MQGVAISYQPVVGGEGRTFYSPPGLRLGTTNTPICLGFHGFTGTYKDPANFETPEGYLRIAATRGRLVCTADWGGDSWGNDATVAAGGKVEQALAICEAMGGHKADHIWLYAGSMGAAAACNWARLNKSKVAGLILIQPAVNIDRIFTENTSGIGTAQVTAAYGSAAAWNAAKATHNPLTYAAEFNGVVPTKVWYSNGDATINPADPSAFAAAAGSEVVVMAGNPPHGTIPPMDDVLEFLDRHT